MLFYRQFGSPLVGHPAPTSRYVDAATRLLGQGFSIGVGTTINAKYFDNLPYRTDVLLGDSEMPMAPSGRRSRWKPIISWTT